MRSSHFLRPNSSLGTNVPVRQEESTAIILLTNFNLVFVLKDQIVTVSAYVGMDLSIQNQVSAACLKHYPFVRTSFHDDIMVDLLQDHVIGKDICIIGEKGMGKTVLAYQFADRLGYSNSLQVIHCYKDMTSRDLLQRRVTQPNGDTDWEYSALVRAAIDGNCCILDGITSTISVLGPSPVHD